MLTGCDAPIRNHKLKKLSQRLESKELSRSEALEIRASLDSMSTYSLNGAEQQLRSFLSIKASDKGFVTHTDDSLYLEVKDYFENHHREMYTEVLYYGGRVYSDMGDYPEALRHYTDALDKLGDGSKDKKLYGTVLSQTAHLLNSLRLYEAALEHLDKAIRIDSILGDSLNLLYDLQMGASIANRQQEYDRAYLYSHRAMPLILKTDTISSTINDMNLARTAYKKGKIEEALKYIKRLPVNIDSLVGDELYVIAPEIYLAAGMKDTALFMLKKIIDSNRPLNRHNAFHILLSDSLIVGMEADTLRNYLLNYHHSLERYYNNNSNEAALMQLSLYNYALHERMRRKTEERNMALLYVIGGILLGFSMIVSLLLWKKYRQQKEINELKDRLKNLATLKTRLEVAEPTETSGANLTKETTQYTNQGCPAEKKNSYKEDENNEQEDVAALRQKMREELLSLVEKAEKEPYQVDREITESDPYLTIRKKIENEYAIPPSDPIWKELEKEVSKKWPDFISNLRLLVGQRLTRVDIHTALMVKCGFRPAEMMKVFSVSMGAIVSRRANLSMKIFGETLSTKDMDAIIRRL